ncbi:GtrA family protein [Brucellaceae bacterium VT-16-1752]|nr:GtrA family protein [Brucellaceae bacterium VT-16-1752]
MAMPWGAIQNVGTEKSMIATLYQALRFGLVGLTNTCIGLFIIYATIYFFGFGPLTANAFGYAIGLMVSFIANRIWTFRDNRSFEKVLPRYLIMAGICYCLNIFTVLIGSHIFGLGPYLVQFLGIGVYTISMFFSCRLIVFNAGSSDNLQAH